MINLPFLFNSDRTMEEKGMEPPDSPPPPYPGYPTNYPARPAGSQPYYPAPSGGLYTNQPGGYLADQSDRSRPILQQGYPPYQQQYGPPHAAAHMTSVGHVIIAQPQQVTGVLSDVQPPMPQTYLALALVTCLCFSPLFGVIALCFAGKVVL